MNIEQIKNNLYELANHYIDFKNINANCRNNLFLENILANNPNCIQRVATVAISFLNLYSPTALIVNTSLSSLKAYQTVQELKQTFITKKWKDCSKHLLYLSFIVTSLALSFLRPRLNLLISHSLHLVHQVYQIGHQLKNREYLEAGKTGIKSAFTAIYLTSLLITSSEILLISIVSQIIFECAQSAQEFSQGKRLEGVTHLLISGIRSYQSKALIQTCHRNWFGKEVTQEIFEKLYENSSEPFENQLIENYYSSYLKNLEIKQAYFERKVFSNLSFKNCKFDHVELIKCELNNVNFNNCFFNKAEAIKSVFNQTSFSQVV
jgi:hypothetical protein